MQSHPHQQPDDQRPDQSEAHHIAKGASVDQDLPGPTSIQGAEAREFADKGRGPIETDPGHELKRKLPRQTGAGPGSGTDVGLRGTPDAADAADHGHRKHN